MQCQKALGFHQKYLNLCSEDEQRSYGFGTTWGWVINDRIFIFGWTIPLTSSVTRAACCDTLVSVGPTGPNSGSPQPSRTIRLSLRHSPSQPLHLSSSPLLCSVTLWSAVLLCGPGVLWRSVPEHDLSWRWQLSEGTQTGLEDAVWKRGWKTMKDGEEEAEH